MLKKLIAGAATAALLATTPAQANTLDRNDVGKLVIGLAAVAVLSAAINNRKEDNNAASEPTLRVQTHRPIPRSNGYSHNDRWRSLSRQNRGIIPSSCLHSLRTRFGEQRIFGRDCLERNYAFTNSLPGQCAVRLYTNSGPRRGFDPHCLRDQGYRSDRRYN